MLRSLVLILILVNAAFWAWTQGWLDAVVGAAVRPDSQHEPQRLAKQVHVDQVVIVPPGGRLAGPASAAAAASAPLQATAASAVASDAASASAAPASAAATPASAASTPTAPAVATTRARTICVEAGPFQANEFSAVEALVKKTLKPQQWQVQSVAVPGLWLVYMGPYPEADMLDKKQAELRRIKGLNFEEVRTPASLAQGLSLGRYNQEAEADRALEQLRNRGVRTARVVNVRAPMTVQLLRVPEADEATQVRLSGLKMPQDKGFIACRS